MLAQSSEAVHGAERLLVSPELADVLSAIVCRIRDRTGTIPLVPSYDTHEKTWNPPMPLLFQRAVFGEHRPISDGALREILQRALAGAGIRGHDGQPLVFTPHDFRRIFVTDAPVSSTGYRRISLRSSAATATSAPLDLWTEACGPPARAA